MNSVPKNDFDLGTFLEENYQLFTLLSVFGAISTYFSRLPTEIGWYWKQLAVSASLSIFLIISILIRRRIKNAIDGLLLDSIIKPQIKSYLLGFFILSFYTLVFTIIGIITNYSSATMLLLQLFAVLIGISSVMWLVREFLSLFDYEGVVNIGFDKEVLKSARDLLVTGISFFVTGSLFLLYLIRSYEYRVTEFLKLQNGQGVVPILFGYTGGFLLWSLFYISLAILLIILHYMIKRLRRRGGLEEVVYLYRRIFGDDSKK